MLKMYSIFDNIIPPQLADYYERVTLLKPTVPVWYVNKIDTNNSNSGVSGFKNKTDELKEMFLPVLYSIADNIDHKVQEIIQTRLFLQLPRDRQVREAPHIDVNRDHYAAIYYVNDSDGDTVLYNTDGSIMATVTPKKNRAVVFNGLIPHCGTNPTVGPRCIINFNFT